MRRVSVVALVVLGCSRNNAGMPDGASPDTPPDARICMPSPGGCADVPLLLVGAWAVTGTHTSYTSPGPSLGDISFQLTFTPAADEGCYDAVATGVPSTAGPNWPDPNGTWMANGFMAVSNKMIAGSSGSMNVSWAYCTAPSNGRLQVTGSSSYFVGFPDGTRTAESFTGSAAKL